MATALERTIFRKGSTTYFWSSAFFPRTVRDDVFKLYSFVRTADDYVDADIPDNESFIVLRKAWERMDRRSERILSEGTMPEVVAKNMVDVSRKYQFDRGWTEAFFGAMQADLDGRRYQTWDDTLEYMYGSAEVIALMMCRIMGLKAEAYQSAQALGRAMQYINFIRDIDEDLRMGRCYFPAVELQRHGIGGLQEFAAGSEGLRAFVRAQIERYRGWQAEGERGYVYLPKRLLTPIKTSVDMHKWTASQIEADPAIVFTTKVKPTRSQVLFAGLKNQLGL